MKKPDTDQPEIGFRQFRSDVRTLGRTELRQKYPKAYSSWSNMKQRARNGKATIAPEFEDFVDFLGHMGPPGQNETLDRIDHTNPLYGPGLVRWLNKKGQANNRSSTIFLSVNGESKPLTVWADLTSQRPETLRARHKRGLPHYQVVYPKKGSGSTGSNIWNWKPWDDLDVKNPMIWNQQYELKGREKEKPIDFFIRLLRGREYQLLAALTKLRDQWEPSTNEADVAQMDQMENEYQRVRSLILLAGKHGAEIRRASSASADTPPPGWTGPNRYRR